MAVSSLLTSLEDMEGSPTIVDYSSGPGASTNTDVFLEASQSVGRRVDNTTSKGQGVSFTAADLSGANEHIKIWVNILQWSATTVVRVRASDGTNNDDHTFPSGEYPPLFGFVPIWVDISRAPEVGGSANEASINEIGCLIDIGNVGGTSQNLLIDEIHHGTSGLLWTGAGGGMGDVRTFESTNNEGNVVTLFGIDYVYSRLEVGTDGGASSTTFTLEDGTIAFPDQALVSTTFMGLTFHLDNASDDYTLQNQTITSSNVPSATNRFDITFDGTTGSATLTDGLVILGARLIALTSVVTVDGGTYDAVEITQSSADISNCTIQTRAASTVACIDDPTFGTTTDLHDVAFVQSGSGHALELGAGTHNMQGLTFTGYGANTTNDAALFINVASGTVTLNISGGGDTPTYRLPGGSTATVVINNSVNVTFTGHDTSSRLYLEAGATVGSVTIGDELDNAAMSTDPYTYSHNYEGDLVLQNSRIRKASGGSPLFKDFPVAGTITSAGLSVAVSQISDE